MSMNMHLWKVTFTKPQSWRGLREGKKQKKRKKQKTECRPPLMAWAWMPLCLDTGDVKPCYTSYFVTEEDTREGVLKVLDRLGHPQAEVKKIKKMGEVSNRAEWVTARDSADQYHTMHERQNADYKTICDLRQSLQRAEQELAGLRARVNAKSRKSRP